jgi:spore coat polysaccharide biosynthesis predicted glycosyltransferase SpsG/RimJ/RimL family protein N-acetyltransferase
MRCLALAQAWRAKGGEAVFAMAEILPGFERRLAREGMEFLHVSGDPGGEVDARWTSEVALRRGVDWMVLDGYHFGRPYRERVGGKGYKVLLVDDLGQPDLQGVDMVLNQNVYAQEGMYPGAASSTRLLMGCRYALIREEFRKQRSVRVGISDSVRKVLVTVGGGPFDEVLCLVIEAIARMGVQGWVVRVLGAGEALGARMSEMVAGREVRLEFHEPSTDMATQMTWADLAVSGAGSICWELAFMGVPTAVVVLAENQERVARSLSERGMVRNLGAYVDLVPSNVANDLSAMVANSDLRRAMSKAGMKLVDGKGGERVVSVVQGLSVPLIYREAQTDDCRLFWEWATDPEIRKASFGPGPDSWEEHVKWFQSRLGDDRYLMYVVQEKREPVGYVRFEREGKDAILSVGLSRAHRGRGLGRQIIEEAGRRMIEEKKACRVHAYVRKDNPASLRAFQAAGYVSSSDTKVGELSAFHLIYSAS